MLVRGIGEATFAQLKPYVSLSGRHHPQQKVKVARGARRPRPRPPPSRRRPSQAVTGCSHRGGAFVPRPAFSISPSLCTRLPQGDPMSTQRGFQLIELMVVLALISMAALIVVPPVLSMSARLRVELAAHELVAALHQARSLRSAAVLERRPQVLPRRRARDLRLYRDGDGDGVRTADIDAGVDPQVTPLRTLVHLGGRVGFGFPPGPAPRDPGDPRPAARPARRPDPLQRLRHRLLRPARDLDAGLALRHRRPPRALGGARARPHRQGAGDALGPRHATRWKLSRRQRPRLDSPKRPRV